MLRRLSYLIYGISRPLASREFTKNDNNNIYIFFNSHENCATLETVVADLQRPDLDVEYLQNETEMFGQALGINKYTE